MSDLDVLMNVMGTLENLQMEISHSEVGMDTYHVLRDRVNEWIDQVIEMIDDYEEGEL